LLYLLESLGLLRFGQEKHIANFDEGNFLILKLIFEDTLSNFIVKIFEQVLFLLSGLNRRLTFFLIPVQDPQNRELGKSKGSFQGRLDLPNIPLQ
jgi:hypothetical protein